MATDCLWHVGCSYSVSQVQPLTNRRKVQSANTDMSKNLMISERNAILTKYLYLLYTKEHIITEKAILIT